MDNMLYIIAGLVIVLLVAVLILRRQKSQQPLSRATTSTREMPRSQVSALDNYSDLASSETSINKFDEVMIAQRFIDQQRYDKAIEAIKRGLINKPRDNALSYKLLNIYAITNQHDAFYNLYNDIVSYSDPSTVGQAKQLKALLDEEQGQTTQILSRNDGGQNNESGFDALDFDLPNSQNNSQATLFHSTTKSTSNSGSDNRQDTSNDIFDLTLDDLETNAVSSDTNEASSTTTLDNLGELSDLDFSDNQSADTPLINELPTINPLEPSSSSNAGKAQANASESTTTDKPPTTNRFRGAENIDEDFSFILDEPTEPTELAKSEQTLDNNEDKGLDFSLDDQPVKNNQPVDITTDDDFVLDFDDLVADSSSESSPIGADSSFKNETAFDSDSFDLNFSLDDESLGDESLDNASLDANSLQNNNLGLTTANNNFDNVSSSLTLSNAFNLTDATLSESSEPLELTKPLESAKPLESTEHLDQLKALENSNFFEFDLDEEIEFSSSQQLVSSTKNISNSATASFDDTLRFDDSTPFEDDLSFYGDDLVTPIAEAPTSTTPVLADEDNGLSQIDFASQFAKDFDFVNELDNSQVTLDLAAKYLELGEYDSAKRLLNEVITQGNSEQQSQAQALLTRTA